MEGYLSLYQSTQTKDISQLIHSVTQKDKLLYEDGKHVGGKGNCLFLVALMFGQLKTNMKK